MALEHVVHPGRVSEHRIHEELTNVYPVLHWQVVPLNEKLLAVSQVKQTEELEQVKHPSIRELQLVQEPEVST